MSNPPSRSLHSTGLARGVAGAEAAGALREAVKIATAKAAAEATEAAITENLAAAAAKRAVNIAVAKAAVRTVAIQGGKQVALVAGLQQLFSRVLPQVLPPEAITALQALMLLWPAIPGLLSRNCPATKITPR